MAGVKVRIRRISSMLGRVHGLFAMWEARGGLSRQGVKDSISTVSRALAELKELDEEINNV